MVHNHAMAMMDLLPIALVLIAICMGVSAVILSKANLSNRVKWSLLGVSYALGFAIAFAAMLEDTGLNLPRQLAGAAVVGFFFMWIPAVMGSTVAAIVCKITSKSS